MKFEPKTEEQINEENLMPAGVYDFEIVEASDEVSQNSGQEMIKLKIKTFNAKGSARFLFDYLVANLQFKSIQASKACGIYDKYEKGELYAHDFVGKCGKFELGIQEASGQYPARNSVKRYNYDEVDPQVKQADTKPPIDDQIPF